MFIPSYMVIIYLKIFPPTWLLPPTCLFQTVEYLPIPSRAAKEDNIEESIQVFSRARAQENTQEDGTPDTEGSTNRRGI